MNISKLTLLFHLACSVCWYIFVFFVYPFPRRPLQQCPCSPFRVRNYVCIYVCTHDLCVYPAVFVLCALFYFLPPSYTRYKYNTAMCARVCLCVFVCVCVCVSVHLYFISTKWVMQSIETMLPTLLSFTLAHTQTHTHTHMYPRRLISSSCRYLLLPSVLLLLLLSAFLFILFQFICFVISCHSKA